MMDLYEVADQIVQLLQQRGRLTSQVLKEQLQLDDEILESMKASDSGDLTTG